jgi:hypothetical protein
MVALLRRALHRPAPRRIVWPIPLEGEPFELPPGVASTGDQGIDRLLAIGYACGAEITHIEAPEPEFEQLALFA